VIQEMCLFPTHFMQRLLTFDKVLNGEVFDGVVFTFV
jgi:hypothetical protein